LRRLTVPTRRGWLSASHTAGKPPIGGEGAICSNVDDMLGRLRHMSDPQIGSRASWVHMRTPATAHGYGLGLSIGKYRGARVAHHAGGVIGGARPHADAWRHLGL